MEFGLHTPLNVQCIDSNTTIQINDMISPEDVTLLTFFFSAYNTPDCLQHKDKLTYLDRYLDIPLVQAYFNPNDYQAYKRLIENKCTKIPTSFHRTVMLQEAISHGDLEIVQRLFKPYLAEPNFVVIEAEKGHLEVLKFLLQYKYKHDISIWYKAIDGGHLDCIKCFDPIPALLNEEILHSRKLSFEKAAKHDNIELFEYLYQLKFSFNEFTCSTVATLGNLKLLTWLHEHNAPWNKYTCLEAAANGHLSCLKYAHENGCPWGSSTVAAAARSGNLDCLQYATEHGCEKYHLLLPTCDRFHVCYQAAEHGRLSCLIYAHQQKYPFPNSVASIAALSGHLECLKYACEHVDQIPEDILLTTVEGGNVECLKFIFQMGDTIKRDYVTICNVAARYGQLSCLQYLFEQGYKWNDETFQAAIWSDNLKCVTYLHENGCYIPDDACVHAVKAENVQCLQYLHEHGFQLIVYEHGSPYDLDTYPTAIDYGYADILAYLKATNCPLSKLYQPKKKSRLK